MTNTHGQPEAVSGSCFRGLINRADLRQLLLEQGLSNLLTSGQVIKEDKNRKIIAISTGLDSEVFVKTHCDSGLIERLKSTVLGSRARRSHKKNELLVEHRLPGPASYGFVDILERQGRGSAHFSEYFPDSQTLAKALAEDSDASLVDSASKLIATLHQQDLIHGDLKLTNLMVSNGKLYFVDLDGLRRSNSDKLRARDIARFLVGLAEANIKLSTTQDAFAAYCQARGTPEESLRDRVTTFVKIFQNKHWKKYQRPVRPIL